MNFFECLKVAKVLFITDCKILKFTLLDKIVNIAIWTLCTLFVNAYLLPSFGIAASFGMVTFGGMMASSGIFEGFSSIVQLVGDLSNDKVTYYYATLPLPTWLMFTRLIVFNAFVYSIISMVLLPMGKMLLWSNFDLSDVNWIKLFLIMIVANLFYGAFALFTTSFVRGFYQIGNVWSRFIFPLWFLGGFMFSWQVLYNNMPVFAYIDLLNPIVYISEGYRAALTGSPDYINFWICLAMTALFGLVTAYSGIKRLKKRCDFM